MLCEIVEPLIVLYCPEALTPVVRCTVIVMDKAVMLAVLDSRSCSSVNQPLLLVTTAVAVAEPPPPPAAFTVSEIVAVRTVEPDVLRQIGIEVF